MGKEKVKCYAQKKVLFAGEKPNEFLKGQSLEISTKKYEAAKANGLVGKDRPALTEYECIKLEKYCGEKVKATVKTSGRHALRG